MRSSSARFLLKILIVIVGYVGGVMVARALVANPHTASIVWIPWPLLVGTLLISPRREWVWILLATVPFNFVLNLLGARDPFPMWLATRSLDYFAMVLSAWLAQRLDSQQPRLDSVRSVLVLYLTVAIIGPALASTGVAVGQAIIGIPKPFDVLWLGWFMINLAGFSLVMPTLVLWHRRQQSPFAGWGLARTFEIFVVVALYWVLLALSISGMRVAVASLHSMMLAVVVWTAIRTGLHGVAAVCSLMTITAAVFPVFPYSSMAEVLLPLDREYFGTTLALGVTTFVGLIIAAAIESERRSGELLASKNTELEATLTISDRRALELRNTNTLLQRVLLRSEALTRELASANAALSASNRAKLEFVRSLAHELRNPIAGARLMAESLLHSGLEPTAHRRVSNLGHCVNYLQTLLDETLDVTQVESGQVAVNLESFTAGEVLAEVSSMFEPLAREKLLAFRVEPSGPGEPVLAGDKTHTKRILINYLSNALKFTQHGTVAVRARVLRDAGSIRWLRFEVSDTGPGVAGPVRDRLFTKFVRESSRDETGLKQGAGLGLALCKQLAELAGGSVGFSSAPGSGSTFWAELPFVRRDQPIAELSETIPDRPDFGELSVCVIDDDPLQLEILTAVLEQFGVTAQTARDVTTALVLLKTQPFDLAFVDYHLAGSSGVQLLDRAREDQPAILHRTRFHLITALWDEDLAKIADHSGFHRSHRKPLSLVQLFESLQDARAAATTTLSHEHT